MNDHPSAALAAFAAKLRAEDIPVAVLRRSEDLFLDWLGSTLAGKSARAVQAIERYALAMGPTLRNGDAGGAEVLISRRLTSPHFAAMVNAAASHVVEQDDVHNGSVFHPAAVVFPAALATAQATGASGREFLAAAVAGYEVGIRVGEFLGRPHYRIFHTTATAGTLAAAAATGRPRPAWHRLGSHATGSPARGASSKASRAWPRACPAMPIRPG
jgi:2-methylcitrate dehydratase PrpD